MDVLDVIVFVTSKATNMRIQRKQKKLFERSVTKNSILRFKVTYRINIALRIVDE